MTVDEFQDHGNGRAPVISAGDPDDTMLGEIEVVDSLDEGAEDGGDIEVMEEQIEKGEDAEPGGGVFQVSPCDSNFPDEENSLKNGKEDASCDTSAQISKFQCSECDGIFRDENSMVNHFIDSHLHAKISC